MPPTATTVSVEQDISAARLEAAKQRLPETLLKVEDYFQTGKRLLIRFKEKGGKENEIPADAARRVDRQLSAIKATLFNRTRLSSRRSALGNPTISWLV